jgi:hypothetical protein
MLLRNLSPQGGHGFENPLTAGLNAFENQQQAVIETPLSYVIASREVAWASAR